LLPSEEEQFKQQITPLDPTVSIREYSSMDEERLAVELELMTAIRALKERKKLLKQQVRDEDEKE
jgi:hypothetical protein